MTSQVGKTYLKICRHVLQNQWCLARLSSQFRSELWSLIGLPATIVVNAGVKELKMTHILPAQVCGCTSTHPRFHTKKRNGKLVMHQNVS